MVWHGPQRGYIDTGGMNLQAPPNHPDPIYAGFRAHPFERNPTTRVPSQQPRGAFTEWETYWGGAGAAH